MKSRALLLLLLALARCTCDLPDVGAFACDSNADCATGSFCLSGRCVPDGTVPSGDGGADGGFDAGPPPFHAAFRFVTPPRTAAVNACSEELDFALVDDAGVQVEPPSDLVLFASANGLQLYSDPLCALPLGSLGADAGFFFSGTAPGMFDVTLFASGCDSAAQQQTVMAPGMNRLVFAATPAPALAGSCVPLHLDELDPANAAVTDSGVSVTLASAPPGLRFYAASDCSGAADASVALGDLWATSESGRDYTVTASATDRAGGTVQVALRPLVHSGTCNLAAMELTKDCAVSPPQLDFGRTFLVYQASSAQHDPERAAVACVLGDAGTVTCSRHVALGTANVSWQTAELSGARVNRYDLGCNPDAGDYVTVDLDASVAPASTFVLGASNATGGDLNGNDTYLATPSATQLQVQWGNGCNARRMQLQLVQVPGFSVTRATGALSGVLTGSAAGLPAPDGGTFALAMWRSASPGNENRLCDRMLRASTTATSVAVSRGLLNPAPQCLEFDVPAWSAERVDVGPRGSVQQVGVTLAANALSAVRTVSAVDLTRTLVFASGQTGGAGQAVGEGFSPVDGGGFLGEVAGTLKLNSATELQLDRQSSRAGASFNIYVLELNP